MVTSWIFMEYRLQLTASLLAMVLLTRILILLYIVCCVLGNRVIFICHCCIFDIQNIVYLDKDIVFQTCFNRHILASEPIATTLVLLSLGYSPSYILPACFVGIFCVRYAIWNIAGKLELVNIYVQLTPGQFT